MMGSNGVFCSGFGKAKISSSATLEEALNVITSSGLLLAVIVDAEGRLIGLVTDSDIRRSVLKGAKLSDAAMNWATKSPLVAEADTAARELHQTARLSGKREIPLLDDQRHFVDLFILGHYDERKPPNGNDVEQRSVVVPQSTPLFILAGGLGTRLRSVVSDRPKPLAMIGNKPIIEILVERVIAEGFSRIYIALNYMADQIEDHFRAKAYPGVDIRFVREEKRLGTAGSIGFVSDEVDESLLVCNADILSKVNFPHILMRHIKERSDLTCCVRRHTLSVPFGVCEISGDVITGIAEKPEYSYFVNAGIYVLNKTVHRQIKKGVKLDMPDVVKAMLGAGKRVVPYLLHEYWLDVGRPEDYQKANEDYLKGFK